MNDRVEELRQRPISELEKDIESTYTNWELERLRRPNVGWDFWEKLQTKISTYAQIHGLSRALAEDVLIDKLDLRFR